MPFETIYVPLLEEGTNVWRPVSAEPSLDGSFRIMGDMPEDEKWAYGPGQKVVVRQHRFADGRDALVAYGTVIEGSRSQGTRVDLTPDELTIIHNALNEVCNGVKLGEEFETRIGYTRTAARALLARLSAIHPPGAGR